MYPLRVIRAAPRIHLPKLDPESICTVFNVAFNTCYTLLHLPKSSLTLINKTISGVARLLIAAFVNDVWFQTLFCWVCLQGSRELAMGICDKAKRKKWQKKQQERQEKEGEGQRERDGDYDNAEATAVQLWRAAVSTEGDEAWARTGASVHAAMTVKVARTDTRRKQSCMQMCV